jgi:hypothetical protein
VHDLCLTSHGAQGARRRGRARGSRKRRVGQVALESAKPDAWRGEERVRGCGRPRFVATRRAATGVAAPRRGGTTFPPRGGTTCLTRAARRAGAPWALRARGRSSVAGRSRVGSGL